MIPGNKNHPCRGTAAGVILCRNPQKTGFPVLLRIREAVDEQNDECDTQQEQHGISSHSVKFFETFVDETSLFGLF